MEDWKQVKVVKKPDDTDYKCCWCSNCVDRGNLFYIIPIISLKQYYVYNAVKKS